MGKQRPLSGGHLWIAGALVLLLAPGARASSFSFTGTLNDPTEVFTTTFTLSGTSDVSIQTWGFGGGTHAAGTVIPAGGFDPLIALFSGTGSSATILTDINGSIFSADIFPGYEGTVNALVSGDVGLTPGATVNVATNPSAPLIVQDTDSLKQKVQGNGSCNFTTGFCTVNFATAPPDKRLVITHLSGRIFATSVQNVSTAQIVQGIPGSTAYSEPIEYLAPTLIGNPNGAKMLAFNHETFVTYGPGQIVQLQVYTDNIGAGGFAQVMYSGYLEPAS
jgi:hypothetical protein